MENRIYIRFSNNPNLIFICADDQQIVSVQTQLNNLGMNSTVCNSYCSFVMGGNHNTISGMATFDNNNNGCDSNDLHFPLIKFKINDGYSDLGASATNSNGIYTFYTLLANNYILPDVENPNWFNFSPASANIFFHLIITLIIIKHKIFVLQLTEFIRMLRL